MYYIHTDHLGSICALSDANSNINERFSYDAWGRRHNPTNWTYNNVNENHWLKRGYTAHEHMDVFGLINMNGRLFDPVLGRMLSPDNYVQAAGFSQNYNRYSYCVNNPLRFTDPSGENPIIIAAIIIGAAAGGYTGYKIADAKGYDMGNWQTYGYMLGGAAIGGFSGYVGATMSVGGGIMANTGAIMMSSSMNSIGMATLSDGMVQPSISFGFGPLNFSTGEFRSIFDWKDLSTMEKIGYSFGATANLPDIATLGWDIFGKIKWGSNFAGNEKISLLTDHDGFGHTILKDDSGNYVSIYPGEGIPWVPGQPIRNWLRDHWFYKMEGAYQSYPDFSDPIVTERYWKPIEGISVSKTGFGYLTDRLNDGHRYFSESLVYQFPHLTCTAYGARALNFLGYPVIGFAPQFLHAQKNL